MTNETKTGWRTMFAMAWLMAAILFCLAATKGLAQEIPAGGSASDFNSVEYFQSPNPQQIKSRISGSEADPLPGGQLLIKQLDLEEYDATGKLQYVITAPNCVYDPVNGLAYSSGVLHLRTGDGKLTVDGEGFLWRQSSTLLTISNQVQAVIEKAPVFSR